MVGRSTDMDHIVALIEEIESRKPHGNAAATYKDTPALGKIEDILAGILLSGERSREKLENAVVVFRYLANTYEYMWRIARAVENYECLIEAEAALFRAFGVKDEEAKDDYYAALRARNYYKKDGCADLVSLGAVFLEEEERKGIEEEIFERYHPLKHDPVELTEEYLSVIDEVEEAMDTAETRALHHFNQAEVKKKLLRDRGVTWRSVRELNPGVHFD